MDVRSLGDPAHLPAAAACLRMLTLLCLALVLPGCFATRALNQTIDRAMHPAKELPPTIAESIGWRLADSDDRGGHHRIAVPGLLVPGRGSDDRKCVLWLPRNPSDGTGHLVEGGVAAPEAGFQPIRIRWLPHTASTDTSLEDFAKAGGLKSIDLRGHEDDAAQPRFTATWFDPDSNRTVHTEGDFECFRRVRSEGELTALRGLYVVTIAGDTVIIAVGIAAIIPIGVLYLAANS